MELQIAATFPPQTSSAAAARDFVGSACVDWHLEPLAEDLALVVTELVANAIRHAGTDIAVLLVRLEGGVRLEVHDGSTRPLRPRSATVLDEGGRGLLLVDALSSRFGVEGEPKGKRVWVELYLDVREPVGTR